MVLSYSVASKRYWKGFNYFGEGTAPPSQDKSPKIHTKKYFEEQLGGASVETWIKTAVINIAKLFLNLILKETILIASRGLVACYF